MRSAGVWSLALLTVLTGCSEPQPAPQAQATATEGAAWTRVAGFERSKQCGPAPRFEIPAPGDRMTTAFYQGDQEVMRAVRTFTRVDGDAVWGTEVTTFADDPRPLSDTTEQATMLNFIDAGFERHGQKEGEHRRNGFPATLRAQVETLEVGQTISLPVTESTNFDGSAKSLSGEFRITLLGCGRLRPPGGTAEAVHVYRVEGFHRAYRGGSPPTDTRGSFDTVSYVDGRGRRLFTGRETQGVWLIEGS